jgi:hypothetical protein
MYLKETSRTIPESYVNGFKNILKCATANSCGGGSFGPMSCLRKNCYSQYLEYYYGIYSDASLRPPICSAQGLAAIFALLVTLLLL